jgi:SAM-dependent methyltransferase
MSIEEQHSCLPPALPEGGWQRAAFEAAGRALLFAAPAFGVRLERKGRVESLTEQLAFAGLVNRHRRAGTLDRLAQFHSRYWSSQSAVSFHAMHEFRFQNTFLGRQYDLVEELQRVVAGGGYRALYEIGCGSGLVVDHLVARFPAIGNFVGIDLCAEQIALNRRRFDDRRLKFVAGDGASWIDAHGEPGAIVFTYGGVLEYFSQPMVEALFASIAKRAPGCIAIAEPVDARYDFARETRSRVFGSELSYSHNYPQLARDAGFDVRWESDVVYGARWMRMIATIG